MLILTRRCHEAIVIGEGDARIRVLSVGCRGEVHIGIEANREIPVHREEIYKKIKQQEMAGTASNQAVEPLAREIS